MITFTYEHILYCHACINFIKCQLGELLKYHEVPVTAKRLEAYFEIVECKPH